MKLTSWLKANLGKRCLAPLAGCDMIALEAADRLAELWVWTHKAEVAIAFGAAVKQMHRDACKELAYHAIARVGNWEDREVLWLAAGLEPLANPGTCANEPGGSARP